MFTSASGGHVNHRNLARRVLKPAALAAGLPPVSWHTLRHSVASELYLTHGLNAVEVQMWLGHHSPAFTLATYVHLRPADLPTISWDTTRSAAAVKGKGHASTSEAAREPLTGPAA